MNDQALARLLRAVSWVIVLLMAAALLYAAGISWTHWSGIGV